MLLQAARVLVVAEPPRALVPLVRSLSDASAYVAVAQNAREAWHLCRRAPSDVVITNSELPDAALDVFSRAVRAVDRATCIVVTYGGGMPSTRSCAPDADVILSTPMDPAAVVARLRNHVQEARTRRAA